MVTAAHTKAGVYQPLRWMLSEKTIHSLRNPAQKVQALLPHSLQVAGSNPTTF